MNTITLKLYSVERTIKTYVFAVNETEAEVVANDAWTEAGLWRGHRSVDWLSDLDAKVKRVPKSAGCISGAAYFSRKYTFPEHENDIDDARKVRATLANTEVLEAQRLMESLEHQYYEALDALEKLRGY